MESHGVKVLQSEVRTRVSKRHARYIVSVALDGPYGPVGLRRLCVEDWPPSGTQEEVELLAWNILWHYRYATARQRED